MTETKRFLDYAGTEKLWRKIVQLCNKKLEHIQSLDDSITVKDKNQIAVNISDTEDNLLQVETGKGLYAKPPVMHTLTFGAGEEYKYDGSKDITVPVYQGQIN